jgi:tetratricopeptide (TPR) repeat protein
MPWAIQTFSPLSDRLNHQTLWIRFRPRCSRVFSLIAALLIFIGCATAPIKKWDQAYRTVPPKHELKAVPFYPQEEYQCGPAALAMALAWSGLQVTTDELAQQVYTPSLKGSLQPAMVAAARRHGRVAYEIAGANALLREIAAGHPVIVLQNLGLFWVPLWHYAVVIGYDLDQDIIVLHSGVTNQKKTPLRTFENTWARSERWGLVVMPPSRLPATAEENAWIGAVMGLEKARQWEGAVTGYKTALSRWPENFSAHIGLSNSYYALGNLKSARDVLQKTVVLFPNKGVAFNNLAQVLWELGKKQEAIKTARQAVNLGGPFVEQYQKTLNEIQADAPDTDD